MDHCKSQWWSPRYHCVIIYWEVHYDFVQSTSLIVKKKTFDRLRRLSHETISLYWLLHPKISWHLDEAFIKIHKAVKVLPRLGQLACPNPTTPRRVSNVCVFRVSPWRQLKRPRLLVGFVPIQWPQDMWRCPKVGLSTPVLIHPVRTMGFSMISTLQLLPIGSSRMVDWC